MYFLVIVLCKGGTIMNNLRFFREMACLTRKELASLMNVTVYTYMGYEEGRMIMYDET